MNLRSTVRNSKIEPRFWFLYSEELKDRTQILVLNKMDLMIPEIQEELETYFRQFNSRVITISAETGAGLDALKENIVELLEEKRDALKSNSEGIRNSDKN